MGIDPDVGLATAVVETGRGFGGDVAFRRAGALLTFDDDSGQPLTLLHFLRVDSRKSASGLPSIVGMDFLRSFNLLVSVSQNRVELTLGH